MEERFTELEIYKQCRLYLSKRERSPLHLRNWLIKKGVPREFFSQIIQKMSEEKFLCEERYLTNIQDQLLQKAHPISVLKRQLLFKGFSKEKIEISLKDVSTQTILMHSSMKKRLEKKEDIEILSFYIKRGFPKSEIIAHIQALRSEFPD